VDAGREDVKAGGEIVKQSVDYGGTGLKYLRVALKSHSILKTNGDVHISGVVNVLVGCNNHDQYSIVALALLNFDLFLFFFYFFRLIPLSFCFSM
jgi:hypothetical protein